ncbi:putative disease resistance RPP13-like protein 3 [Panicum miliaceum]|uniref:Disease resistance RPP13-like protein 3 n=1 Tax=Panicum miliaceum TaxID=4540 RepID=A0A3L6QS24_PANMI|nr:putative disease resistance RPP13-like protein 3 [Panicum miliaceum]
MGVAVVGVWQGALGTLLGKLGVLLADEYKLLTGAKSEVRFLKSQLESMHAFLKKMSDVEDPDEQAKCWAREVRELSYDIEDKVDELMLRAGVEHEPSSSRCPPHGFMRLMDRCLSLFTTIKTRYEVAKEFQCLKRRAVEVIERRTRYKVDEALSKPSYIAVDLRLLAIYAETTGLVGIDVSRAELIQMMEDKAAPAQQLKVLSIVGFGGLGKTTLANEIYRKLQGEFQSSVELLLLCPRNLT